MVDILLDSALIKQKAIELGFDQCGVCPATEPPHFDAYRSWLDKGYHGTMGYLPRQLPLRENPAALLPGAHSIIAVTLNYNQDREAPPHFRNSSSTQIGKGQEENPKIARYALGRDYHKVIRNKLRRLAWWLSEEYPDARHRPCVDSAPVMERDFAQAAGLGWFGKNTMLINSRRGSWFFIGLLLTTLEIEPDKPSVGGCGKCTKCIDACPTGAIVFEENRWQLDARRCISYLTIEHKGPIEQPLAEKMDGWVFGCDICQEVCPFNEQRSSQPLRGRATAEPDLLTRLDWPSTAHLSELGHKEWDALTRGSAVRRAGLAGLRRNAAIALCRTLPSDQSDPPGMSD